MFGFFRRKSSSRKDKAKKQTESPTVTQPKKQAEKKDPEKEESRLVHIQKLENTTSSLLQEVPLNDLKWRLQCSSWITETRTFYIINEVGEYMFVQLAYTDSGWPIQASCQVSSCYFDVRLANEKLDIWKTCSKLKLSRSTKDPNRGLDGHVVETANHPASKLKISDSKTALKIVNAEMRLVGPDLTASYDVPSGKVKGKYKQDAFRCFYEGGALSIDLVLEAPCPAIRFGDGNITFGMDESDGFINGKFIPGLCVKGTIYVDGVARSYSGLGVGIHQVQGVRPNQVASRWNTALFISDKNDGGNQTILFMNQIRTSASYGNENINYGIYFADGKLQAISTHGLISTFEPRLDSHSGYYVPHELAIEWCGETTDKMRYRAECHVKPQILIDRVNLLNLLPFVMRKIVETFVTRPYVYQWADRTVMTIEKGDNKMKLDGWIINELSILNDEV